MSRSTRSTSVGETCGRYRRISKHAKCSSGNRQARRATDQTFKKSRRFEEKASLQFSSKPDAASVYGLRDSSDSSPEVPLGDAAWRIRGQDLFLKLRGSI